MSACPVPKMLPKIRVQGIHLKYESNRVCTCITFIYFDDVLNVDLGRKQSLQKILDFDSFTNLLCFQTSLNSAFKRRKPELVRQY